MGDPRVTRGLGPIHRIWATHDGCDPMDFCRQHVRAVGVILGHTSSWRSIIHR